MEVEPMVHESVFIWDTSITGCCLTCFTTMLTPRVNIVIMFTYQKKKNYRFIAILKLLMIFSTEIEKVLKVF